GGTAYWGISAWTLRTNWAAGLSHAGEREPGLPRVRHRAVLRGGWPRGRAEVLRQRVQLEWTGLGGRRPLRNYPALAGWWRVRARGAEDELHGAERLALREGTGPACAGLREQPRQI